MSISGSARAVQRRASAKIVFFFLTIVGFAIGAVLELLGEFGLYLALSIVFVIFGLLVFQRPTLLVYGVILVSTLMSVFREIAISVGNTQMTLSGLQWLLIAILMTLFFLIRLQQIHIPGYAWPFMAFLVWAMFRWLIQPTGMLGLKDVMWYSMPALISLYMPLALRQTRNQVVNCHLKGFESMFLYSAIIPLVLYGIAFSTKLAEMTWRGPVGMLIGMSRGIALYLLIVLSIALSNWRYGPFKRKGLLVSVIALGVVFFTLARMASFLALYLSAIHRVNPRRKWHLLVAGVIVIAITFYAITHISVLKQRFFFVENWDLSAGLKGINTAGRNVMWRLVFSSAMKKPVLGWGIGRARLLVGGLFVEKSGITQYHPHNEYLQVFHDLGFVGLVLMGVAWGGLLRKAWRWWEKADNPWIAKWSMAATLSIIVVLISSGTDNTMHYPFIINPAMVVVGIASFLNEANEKTKRAQCPIGGINARY